MCPVSRMRDGQWGELMEINGGTELTEKLASLGIRQGTRIGRKYGLMGRGPVVVTVGTGEVAIGYGMAEQMMVRVEDGGVAAHTLHRRGFWHRHGRCHRGGRA